MEQNLSKHVLFCFVHLITWSWDNEDLVHERDARSIVLTLRISSEYSNTNVCVKLNKLWISSKFVFLFFQIRQKIWPKMNGCSHWRRHEQSPYQYTGLHCFNCKCWVTRRDSELLLEILENLRHIGWLEILMSWNSFVFTSRTSFLVLVELEDSSLSSCF